MAMCFIQLYNLFVHKCEEEQSILLLAFVQTYVFCTLGFSVYSEPDGDDAVCHTFSVNASYDSVDL